jgi:hypothetical protein
MRLPPAELDFIIAYPQSTQTLGPKKQDGPRDLLCFEIHRIRNDNFRAHLREIARNTDQIC